MNSEISFGKLPPEYKRIIARAEEKFNIEIKPLQVLVGGWSGAMIYLVSVASGDGNKLEHLILKLDRKKAMSKSDESTRHQQVLSSSPEEFINQHLPEMVYGGVEDDEAVIIFYSIAGQSLRKFQTLSSFSQQSQLEMLFRNTNHYLLDVWNPALKFEQLVHPQTLLNKWLGFRLDEGQKIENFVRDVCDIDPSVGGLIIDGNIFPNPLFYSRNEEAWGDLRPLDAIFGLQHSDLNTNNILAKFAGDGEPLEGCFFIDFALYKENMPLLYDQRYLEMSYLVQAGVQGSFTSMLVLISQIAENELLETNQAPIEMSGVNSVLSAGRTAFRDWVKTNHATLDDDLWGQYWLAGAAAGLSYCHKAGQPDNIRAAGLIFAAANLKQFFNLFEVSLPKEASHLYSKGQFGGSSASDIVFSPTSKKVVSNLPSPLSQFIGREKEMEEITALLRQDETRLVTMTGPGGMGKTTLGLNVCRKLIDDFQDGVYFIDLAALQDPSLFASVTAQTLGVREGGGRDPLENLKSFLSNKNIFLLLDNFEQITDAASDVADLLVSVPGLKTLVTSRIPLHVRGEQEYPVSPLSVPLGLDHSLEEIDQFEAVALFKQQAQMIQPKFDLTEENSEVVIEICRRLDGLPLAIEIAASRIKMLSVESILEKLDRSLNLLVGGAKDLPDRQRTLRGAIDWSYELLEPETQKLFVRLGVFAGGFTLEAVEAVCNPAGELDVFSGIETLLDSSLVRQVRRDGGEPRFDLLQTIRQYALEMMGKEGVLEETQLAHATYFGNLAEQAEVIGSQSTVWLKRLDEEKDNLRMTLGWGLEDVGRLHVVIPGLRNVHWFWYRFGHLKEGREWAEKILEMTKDMGDNPLRAMSLYCAATIAMWMGDLLVSYKLNKETLEMCKRLRFDLGAFAANLGVGTNLVNQGKDKEAYPYLVDAVELSDDMGMEEFKTITLVHLANASLGLGDAGEAMKWLDMALPGMKASGDDWIMAFGFTNYGEVARVLGNFEEAEEYYRKTQELFIKEGANGDQARLVNVLGYIAQHKGDLEEAGRLFRQSLRDFRELGNQRGIAESLAGLATLAVVQGKDKWAAPLLSAAESQLFAFGGVWWPADRVEIELARERMRTALGDDFEAHWEMGQTMGIEDAMVYIKNDGS